MSGSRLSGEMETISYYSEKSTREKFADVVKCLSCHRELDVPGSTNNNKSRFVSAMD